MLLFVCRRTLLRKSMPMVAWYVLSNESYMKRVIRDVLPTVEVSEHFVSAGARIEWERHTTLFAQEYKHTEHQYTSSTFAAEDSTYLNFLSGFEYPACAIVNKDLPRDAAGRRRI